MKDILQEKFIYNVLDTNPVERTKTILLRDEIEKRFIRLEESKIIPMLSILLDQYGDSPEAKIDGKKYFNYVHVKRGEKAPEFSVKLLQDSTKHITNNNFKGKYCLLEFMSSTSSACKDEIVNLKKAYDKYSREKLDIVTISLDSSAVDAAKFIRENVEVPCFNAIEEKGLDSKLCKNFEVYSFPKAVLINPEGIISAVGWDLHSKNFLNTMKKYLGE
jgi:peroxiredoxin